ncbi:phage tail assembly chaperone [Pannonibacter sp. P2PFMT1]|uniref:phage tail assembly chaperone n=1 Tax=Pannonibacter sp. P2PFMT1 TaxID=2003582 RepID=UPI0021119ED9|nr:phage tail assembly chaperone [Pannonibacter sp. P2PFMT1]
MRGGAGHKAAAGGAGAFPWEAVLHAAMGRLGWSPAGTWAATPRELAFALGLRRGAGALNRRGLEALMQRFPDEGGTGWQTTA